MVVQITNRSSLCLFMVGWFLTLPCWGCGRAHKELGEGAAREGSAESVLQPDDDAKTIVGKALKVVGDEASLSQWKCGIIKYKSKGKLVPGESTESELEDSFQLPGQFRRVMRAKGEGKSVTIIYVYNRGDGWVKKEGMPAEPIEIPFADRIEHPFAEYSRLPMLRGTDLQQIGPPGERVDGKEVVGIRIRQADLTSFDCFFERRTGLMLKFTNNVPGTNPGRASTLYTFLNNFEKIRGCTVPMHIKRVREGETMLDVRISHLQFLPNLDGSLFAKP